MSSKTRENDDQISKIMGSYLLKGCTLLDDNCHRCQTPLMRLKNKTELYCIYCNEIDKTFQNEKITKCEDENISDGVESETWTEDQKISECIGEQQMNDNIIDSKVFNRLNNCDFTTDIETTRSMLQNKIKWATDKLSKCNSANNCIQYCELIKICSDTIQSVNKLIVSQKMLNQ